MKKDTSMLKTEVVHVRLTKEEYDRLYRYSAANGMNIASAIRWALKSVTLVVSHRVGDCFSDDYMGLCVCGMGVTRNEVATTRRGLSGSQKTPSHYERAKK